MSKLVLVPFSEPPWLMGLPSTYYNESHRKWQKTCRALVDKLLMPEGGEWERAGDVPGILSSQSFNDPFNLTVNSGPLSTVC